MSAELQVSTDFYILDQEFNKVFALTQYESLMWVDKYDEPGTIQIYAPPTDDIKKYAIIGNYIQSSRSEHIMVIEKLITTYSSEDGERLTIEGRSLESILDRRVIFLGFYLTNRKSLSDEEGANNLEDAIKRLLDHTFIDPENEDRAIPNFIFEYSDSPVPLVDSNRREILDSDNNPILADNLDTDKISDIEVENMEFEKGENVLNIVNTIVKSKGLGYKITLNSQKQLVFKLIKGVNRTIESGNPLVEFSPMFNNIKDTTYTVDGGENYRNYIYTEGEIYNGAKPKIIETGDATGLNRREHYIVSDSTHEKEGTIVTHEEGIVKENTVLSNEDYEKVLQEEGEKSYKAFSLRQTMESEVEPRLQFVYGRDFFIGDILQIKDKSGNTGYSRCVEFIISHSASGYEEYPTFEDVNEEQETPSQTTASGGEYSEKGKMTNDEIIREAGGGGAGHTYDLEPSSDKSKVTLTEDGEDKTTLPLVSTFVGTRAEWDALSATEQAKYRILHFTDVDEHTSVFSHVGQIIESTTLDTEVKVKAIYGSNTHWISHTGYVLRGAVSSVVANQASNDGGADSVTVSSVANHNHDQNSHGHQQNIEIAGYEGWSVSQTSYMQYAGFANPANRHRATAGTNVNTGTRTATNIAKGANYTVNTLPKYKNVYIWERVS